MEYRIRTSDRTTFRRCRRKWNWSSHLRNNLEQIVVSEPLWTGTGFHYSLEDWHGNNQWGDPVAAFMGFVEACKKTPRSTLPDAWVEEVKLATGMLAYYRDHWLASRDTLQTYWLDGVPQVEVNFEIRLPINGPNGEDVFYTGTIDKVVVDQYGRLWVLDYKTAKNIVTAHLALDQQMTSYMWAASVLYDKPIAGGIYQQHKKALPDAPRWLASGRFSTNKDQNTTRHLYKKALLGLYGSVEKTPKDNVDFLNYLASMEGEHGDKYIQRDFLERNEYQIAAEGEKILMEVPEMLDTSMPLYPNPTRDCSWDCDFKTACLMIDDGSDWEYELSESTQKRDLEETKWRLQLNLPEMVNLAEVPAN